MSRKSKTTARAGMIEGGRTKPTAANIDPLFADWALLDPIGTDRHLGTRGCTYTMFDSMARVPIVSAIIQTRVNNVSEFAHEQATPFTNGWRLVPEDGSWPLSRRDKVGLGQARELIHTAGDVHFLGGFESFLQTITRDSLTVDQANFEVLRDLKGVPWGFIPVDPTTIRRAQPNRDQLADLRWDSDETGYVQVVDYAVVAEFGFRDLGWGIRRPRSSLRANNYGFPELEELLGTVANFVNTMTYNSVNFTTGLNAHTLITLSSKMQRNRFQEAERLITAGLSGIRNNKRVPVIQLDPMLQEELKVHLLGKTNEEMQYGEWINFLLKLLCGVFQMDPAELNFIFGNEGVKNQINGGDPGQRVTASRERGLRPLLRKIASWINYWLIKPTWPQFRFEFAGFDSQTEKDKLDMDNKACQFWESPNAIRRARGKAPFPHPRAEYPLHPSFDAIFQQAQAAGPGAAPPMQGAASMGDWMSGSGLPDPEANGLGAGGMPAPPDDANDQYNPNTLQAPA